MGEGLGKSVGVNVGVCVGVVGKVVGVCAGVEDSEGVGVWNVESGAPYPMGMYCSFASEVF